MTLLREDHNQPSLPPSSPPAVAAVAAPAQAHRALSSSAASVRNHPGDSLSASPPTTIPAADARPRPSPGPVARSASSEENAKQPSRPRYSVSSKSSSAVPTLSTASARAPQRFLPTYWLPPAMATASGVNPTATDLLRQAMLQR
ncbi:hypothetical protein CC78DRAFT_534645 [Lojkania enalia]|uniref:Uncharacterized protein n=1 Tax=Lojkania enalia TaxID=147567 RepID=A0A9P4N1Q4_9PLEO|nr:hypothetical protein CC78DRAFT_534645 [Didymosphaeria enalia]